MQVIAGSARRLQLMTVPGTDTRPTSSQIRETLFNILQPYVQGSRFLDLFAGSGAIGIEALSRGAAEAVFVENSRKAVACIGRNLAHTRLAEKARVLETSAVTALKRLAAQGACFDLIFLDPPYDGGWYRPVFEALAASPAAGEETLIIAEARKDEDFSFLEELGFVPVREKVYKSNKHVFVRRKEAAR
ncbi:MAG: 16S rRNA (guanine(966)-N(2))-methyltransferase RsmD [Lachnospiraceae bacterium]|nr:16S rRNA (guanine(966)-N(2))-methyltransferase RsmD [Lachnospiraceae bacterium]